MRVGKKEWESLKLDQKMAKEKEMLSMKGAPPLIPRLVVPTQSPPPAEPHTESSYFSRMTGMMSPRDKKEKKEKARKEDKKEKKEKKEKAHAHLSFLFTPREKKKDKDKDKDKDKHSD